jgi:glutamine synthetase
MPKPILDDVGSSLLININVTKDDQSVFSLDAEKHIREEGNQFMAGVLDRLPEITAILNMSRNSYDRLNRIKEDLSIPDLIRVQPECELRRIALCSPDNTCNIYMALNLILHAGIEGIENKKTLCDSKCKTFADLPSSLDEAIELADKSELVNEVIGEKTWKNLKESLSKRS